MYRLVSMLCTFNFVGFFCFFFFIYFVYFRRNGSCSGISMRLILVKQSSHHLLTRKIKYKTVKYKRSFTIKRPRLRTTARNNTKEKHRFLSPALPHSQSLSTSFFLSNFESTQPFNIWRCIFLFFFYFFTLQ